MIDPDLIIPTEEKKQSIIDLKNIPEFDFETYCNLESDPKEYKKYISDIEKECRGSFEYKQLIQWIRVRYNACQCAFLATVSNADGSNIKIELHHYPFTLYDICEIVYRKRVYYHESLELEMVAKEIMILHYKLMIGLVPLSTTVHKLVHNGKLFIPTPLIIGRYNLFMDYYDKFIEPEHKDIVSRIEKYSNEEQSYLLNTTILDANNLKIVSISPDFQLPNMDTLSNRMSNQIDTIKANSYKLPTIRDVVQIEDKRDRIPVESPIYTLTEEEKQKIISIPLSRTGQAV